MKRLMSIIALIAILFSSMGTSISVYAESLTLTAPTNNSGSIATI